MSKAIANRSDQGAGIATMKLALEKMVPQFRQSLPNHIPVERFLRVALAAAQNSPALLQCDRNSLYRALLTAAQLGLEPDGLLGQGYLVPFKGRVQFIPGYRGYILLARQSGEIVKIAARLVRAGDQFAVTYGSDERIEHRPAGGEPGEILSAYAIAWQKNAPPIFEVMRKAEIDAIRERAPGGNSDAWKNHYPEMARKTVIRRLAKYLPLTVQPLAALEDAIERGNHVVNVEKGDLVLDIDETPTEIVPAAEPTKPSALDSFAAGAAVPAPKQEQREPGAAG